MPQRAAERSTFFKYSMPFFTEDSTKRSNAILWMEQRRIYANIREELSMTQCEKILDYMRSNGSITPLDALREFGCMRLASRINDLKRQGIGITNTIETNINRYGEKIRYSRYKLEENN